MIREAISCIALLYLLGLEKRERTLLIEHPHHPVLDLPGGLSAIPINRSDFRESAKPVCHPVRISLVQCAEDPYRMTGEL